MQPANRQDVQNIVEAARNRLMQGLPVKQDIVFLSDSVRNLTNLNQQVMQLLKQADYQRSQQSRRIVALEARLVNIETELRSAHSTVSRLSDQKPQQVIMPVQTEQELTPEAVEQLYRSANY